MTNVLCRRAVLAAPLMPAFTAPPAAAALAGTDRFMLDCNACQLAGGRHFGALIEVSIGQPEGCGQAVSAMKFNKCADIITAGNQPFSAFPQCTAETSSFPYYYALFLGGHTRLDFYLMLQKRFDALQALLGCSHWPTDKSWMARSSPAMTGSELP